MYRSTFSHLNSNYDVPTTVIHPAQTSANTDSRRSRRGSGRVRRRLTIAFARPAPRGGC